MEVVQEFKSFDGLQQFIAHESYTTNSVMRFSCYTPPQLLNSNQSNNGQSNSKGRKFPILYFYPGMTSSDENFTFKSGMQALAARYGMIVVVTDTSPRGHDIPDDDGPNLGQGAGFYINAQKKPWQQHYQMYDYIHEELPALINTHFAVDKDKVAVMGHSMGGHAALLLALRHSDKFHSVSAIAPLASLMQCSWGETALSEYIGHDAFAWADYDVCVQMQKSDWDKGALIDYGLSDPFESQVNYELMKKLNDRTDMDFTIRFHHGYDHSYFFIATMLEDHFAYHAKKLQIHIDDKNVKIQNNDTNKQFKMDVGHKKAPDQKPKRHFNRKK